MALGVLGLSLDDWMDITPDEFVQAYNAYIEHTGKQQQVESERGWERTRAVAYQIALPYMKEHMAMKEWWPFGWDVPDEKPKYDRNKNQKRFERLKQMWND